MRKRSTNSPYVNSGLDYAGEVSGFLKDRCVSGEVHSQWAANLYSAYVDWALAGRRRVLSSKGFGIGMRELGFERRKSSFIVWLGVRLVSDAPRLEVLPLSERKLR